MSIKTYVTWIQPNVFFKPFVFSIFWYSLIYVDRIPKYSIDKVFSAILLDFWSKYRLFKLISNQATYQLHLMDTSTLDVWTHLTATISNRFTQQSNYYLCDDLIVLFTSFTIYYPGGLVPANFAHFQSTKIIIISSFL